MLPTGDHMKQEKLHIFLGFKHIWKHWGLKQAEQGRKSKNHFSPFDVGSRDSVPLVSNVPETFAFERKVMNNA